MRTAAALVLLCTLVVTGLPMAHAQQDDPPVTIREDGSTQTTVQTDGGGIIPRPNSGVAPQSPTDRGGALQLALLGLLLLFPVVAVVSIRRQGRRHRVRAHGQAAGS